VGGHPVALRLRVGRLYHGGRAVPAVGPGHGPRPALYVLGGRGPGAADRLYASAQHRALAGGDGKSVSHEKGPGCVREIGSGGRAGRRSPWWADGRGAPRSPTCSPVRGPSPPSPFGPVNPKWWSA